MMSISLFYCCETVFNLMNKWMIGKNSMKEDSEAAIQRCSQEKAF